ncbi:MAG TPA: FecR domain-containing protein [Thermoanaerobaculia bacterium]|jgi:ferric-dicitrate binding protein FerR (iron transport regulator)|nr:FecR domain-containing protein [Thermoanaerobaculia bacterium]
MSLFSNRIDEARLDQAISEIASTPVDEHEMAAAASRVRAKLSQYAASGFPAEEQAPEAIAPSTPTIHAVHSPLRRCEDFQAEIPAYLAGELPAARALLVEDHTRSCVPCRRALRTAREGKPQIAAVVAAPMPQRRDRRTLYALAAVLVAALGTGLFLMQDFFISGGQMARVEAIEGSLYRIDGEQTAQLGAGAAIREGDEIRTAKGSHAFVRMTDGSVIEMSERAGLSLDAGRKGNTIELERGKIIVQAAKQRPRHLYVETDDCLVAVTGTIFSVNHGTKGSRVAVVEGEVHVNQSGRENILHPGGQVVTAASLSTVPVTQEIAWSKNAAQYDQLLAELTAASADIDSQIERPGLRYSTRLLDLSPADTKVFIALPNLARNLGETQRLLDQKLAESETLRQWWQENFSSDAERQKVHDLIDRISELGSNLGPEIAIAVGKSGTGETSEPEPVLTAEVENEAAFRAALIAEIDRLNGEGGEHKHTIRIVESLPATATAGEEHELLLYVGSDLFVASPNAALINQVAANSGAPAANPFVASAFRNRVADSYQDGAGWLFSADLASLIGGSTAVTNGPDSEDHHMAETLGILDLDQFIVERRDVEGRTETRAVLTFKQARRGVAAWLAEPAPMRALDFVSPDANAAAAFVVKNPATLLDELLAANPKFATELSAAEAREGFNLRDDVVATLGGEFALALDGPVLPKPSWKFVAEVYDPATLQHTIEVTVERLNRELKKNGKGGVTLTTETTGGRTWHAINSEDLGMSIHYAFEGGFLVAAPSRTLIERAFSGRESGATLGRSERLKNLLGTDGQINVSALVFQDLGALAKQGAKFIPQKALEQDEAKPFRSFLGQGPSAIYAYAEEDRILFGSNAVNGPLGDNLKLLTGFSSILRSMGGHGGDS